jgi:hypothetical protein
MQGIFQGDIIIKTALEAAINDVRANPTLLDYCLSSLNDDDLTSAVFGQKTIDIAKEWFNTTKIPVIRQPRRDQIQAPSITIALRESNETENTLGDVHSLPTEDLDQVWPILAGPFTPISYAASTGTFVVPASASMPIGPQIMVVDRVGRTYPIVSIIDNFTFTIAPNSTGDFSQVTIKGTKPSQVVQIESANFSETYTIGCHATGDDVNLIILHSIVTFCLLRYRQALLEARGFERSRISSGDLIVHEGFEDGREHIYSRYIQLSGFIKNTWPKMVLHKIQQTTLDLDVVGMTVLPGFDDTKDSIGPVG